MDNWIAALAVGWVTASLLAIPVGILVALAVFFAVRWLLLWFFKVNQALALLTESADTLRDIRTLLRSEAEGRARAVSVVEAPSVPEPADAVAARLRRVAPVADQAAA